MSSTKLRVKELLRERRWTTKVLAEKTGMSESYLTHIKNGTRRWNEDALRKLADAFELDPTDLFAHCGLRTDNVDQCLNVDAVAPEINDSFKLKVVPVVGDIPSAPSPYNNQVAQVTTGFKNMFVPIFGSDDDSMFCLAIEDSAMAPKFVKGDRLIISPAVWTRSGDIVAVEFGPDKEKQTRTIMQVNYMDDFVVLESVNHKRAPVALVRGKDNFRIIGKVIARYQKMA